MKEIVGTAYERWDAGDHDGLLSMFPDDSMFVIPGSTAISGDHDKAGFRRVLDLMQSAVRSRQHNRKLICSYDAPGGSACVFDNYVTVNETEIKYHSVHEWILRDGVPQVWMLYVHEYDIFQAAWE